MSVRDVRSCANSAQSTEWGPAEQDCRTRRWLNPTFARSDGARVLRRACERPGAQRRAKLGALPIYRLQRSSDDVHSRKRKVNTTGSCSEILVAALRFPHQVTAGAIFPASEVAAPRRLQEVFRLWAHCACVVCTLPQVSARVSKTRSKRNWGFSYGRLTGFDAAGANSSLCWSLIVLTVSNAGRVMPDQIDS